MVALVTGGTGFIGRHLVAALVGGGARVRVLARDPARAAGLDPRAEVVAGTLTAPADAARAAAGAEVVFHLAGQIRPTADGPAAYRRSNVDATAALLAACRTIPLAAFVHVSSVGVMGRLAALPAHEGTPCRPDSDYGRSKAEAERLARQAGADGLPVVIARPAWVYGPGDRRTLRLFSAIQRRRFVLVGAGGTWLHPVYVGDLVEGLVRCATTPKALGETYILAGPEPVRLRDLCALVARLEGAPVPRLAVPRPLAWLGAAAAEGLGRLLGRPPLVYRRQLEFFVRDQLFATTKAREELGFTPATSLRDGLRRTIAWYREQNLFGGGPPEDQWGPLQGLPPGGCGGGAAARSGTSRPRGRGRGVSEKQ
jgi:nucleoside-diphosphate-sugar epimerase